MKMLHIRCPLQLNEDVSLQNKDTARLLSEGKKIKATPKPHNLLLLITVPLHELFYCIFLLFDLVCILKSHFLQKETDKQVAVLFCHLLTHGF